jgi:hypothetical protein
MYNPEAKHRGHVVKCYWKKSSWWRINIMKKQILCLLFLFLLFPYGLLAQETAPITTEGYIGDSAPKARIYEINGTMYQFPGNIVIKNQYGKRLTFNDLRGGVRVRIIGEKTVRENRKSTITYKEIILLK